MTIQKVADKKLICFSDKYFLYSKGPKLYVSRGIDNQIMYLGKLPVGTLKSVMGSARVLARALRLEPRCGIFVNKTVAILSYHGAVYRVNCDDGTIEFEHQFRKEMNNPLCFTRVENVPGFTDAIYYGEYFMNHDSAAVKIYRRDDAGKWESVYKFPAGSIYHIHGLIPSPNDECIYVLTGDKDSESGIFRATDNFKEMHAVVTGKQTYRACVALPIDGGLLYTTDTPLENNYLYKLDFFNGKITEVMPISGPCIYGKVISDAEMIFSTSVEPDSRISGMKYEFTYRLGSGVKDRNSHLYYVKCDESGIEAREIFSAEKDSLPMGAFQFGTIMFPEGQGKIYFTCQALRKYDNATLLIEDINDGTFN